MKNIWILLAKDYGRDRNFETMKKLLPFIFFYVFRYYKKKWSNYDPEIYALSYLCLWIYWNLLFSIFLFCNIVGINYYFWGNNDSLKFIAFIPAIIIGVIAWRKLISDDGYKEWVKPKLFEEPIYSGRIGTLLFWFLFFIPILISIAMILTIPE